MAETLSPGVRELSEAPPAQEEFPEFAFRPVRRRRLVVMLDVQALVACIGPVPGPQDEARARLARLNGEGTSIGVSQP